jgi:hypothetical protein
LPVRDFQLEVRFSLLATMLEFGRVSLVSQTSPPRLVSRPGYLTFLFRSLARQSQGSSELRDLNCFVSPYCGESSCQTKSLIQLSDNSWITNLVTFNLGRRNFYLFVAWINFASQGFSA